MIKLQSPVKILPCIKQVGKAVHTRQHLRMIYSQHLLPLCQCPSTHLFSLLVLPLILQHRCQIAHTRQRRRITHSQHPLPAPSPALLASINSFLLLARTALNIAALTPECRPLGGNQHPQLHEDPCPNHTDCPNRRMVVRFASVQSLMHQ